MTKCAVLEPTPTRFYAPVNLFAESDLKQLGAEWLGEWIVSPGFSFRYRVATGPLCRLYWGSGKPEPHAFESAYFQDERGRWKRLHPNFLSYQLVNGEYITVRWQSPVLAKASCANQQKIAA